MLVAEQMGRAITLEPWFATVVLGGGFLRHAGQHDLVPGIAEGSVLLAFAQQERQSRYDLFDVLTTARPDGGGWLISGRKGMVLHGDSADHFIVTARISGEQRDHAGIGVFLVPAKAEGVSIRGFRQVDGTRAAEVDFTDARASHCLAEDGLPWWTAWWTRPSRRWPPRPSAPWT
jgi:alkylation response protein AidB-like acyl-CoA dehydrogenase